ncbi:5'-deoxyadenosine deaminase [Paenibacillus athensensis]|uniref:5-methylthioadenosine/S-adenosylhomocysteine deaminase n=1 Tax=Paenibacillus athensensis TaxID=1967502 RepID=A0A4Y8QBH6_9BACL|nr:5'-deoxyadenosine deaminase [Paenibacillus athensensis]MCD1257513.1 5'-deoxyadenosine deaminase [Paenibacillus athensensis]
MGGLYIRGAQIVTMNDREDILFGDVRIENDRIVHVGTPVAPQPDDRIIEAAGKVLIPGLIQTHIHLCQTLFRGQADDLELLDWLSKRIWPLEAAHDEESVYYSALLGLGELIRSGTTAIVDMETVHHTDYAFQAMAQSGIRAISGKVMMDFGTEVPLALREQTQDSVDESVRLLEKWHGYANGRLQYAFCPRFVISCTEELLLQVRERSRHYGVKVHTHASENRKEIEIVEAQRGKRNIAYLAHLGLTSPDLILAHCIWLDEEEKEILRRDRVKVSHCPGSNLKLASGIAAIPELLTRDIALSLGADGAPCNNNLDMFHEMRLASHIQKVQHGPRTMEAKTVFRMATRGGAEVMGLERDIGSIEPGKKADLVLLDLNDYHTYPSAQVDIYGRLVYSATRADVVMTIIDGRVVMENGVVLTLDKATVLREANRSIERLLRRLPDIC